MNDTDRELKDEPQNDQPPEPFDKEAVKTSLRRGRRFFLRELGLPITLVFKSDLEATSVYVDKAGNVSISRGTLPDPNVIIEGSHAALCTLLQTKEAALAAPGPLRITITKGEIKSMVIDIAEGETMENPLTDILSPQER